MVAIKCANTNLEEMVLAIGEVVDLENWAVMSEDLRNHFGGRQVGVDHLDRCAVVHDFVDRSAGQIKRAHQTVAILFFHCSFGVTGGDGTRKISAQGITRLVRSGDAGQSGE